MRRAGVVLIAVLLMAVGAGLDRLLIRLQKRVSGMRYLTLAQETMSPSDRWRHDPEVARYLPRAIRSGHDASVWLLLRAAEESPALGRTVDTFLGELLVFEDCEAAKHYLERAAANDTAETTATRVLEGLERDGCRQAVKSRLEATRDALQSGAIPANEMSLELLALGEAQLKRLDASGPETVGAE